MVDPHGQRTASADGERLSKSVARETGRVSEEEREKWETGIKESSANTLHVVFHFPTATSTATAAAAAAAGTVRLQ